MTQNKPRKLVVFCDNDQIGELSHYSSQYYNPEKAHEYYMRNRDLKGRRSTTELSEEGKEVWRATKANITDSRKRKLEAERILHEAKVRELRGRAEEARERIAMRIKEALTGISERTSQGIVDETKDTQKELEKESKKLEKKKTEVSGKIEELMDEDLSFYPEAVRQELIAERDAEIAKLRGEVEETSNKFKKKTVEIREDSKEDKTDIREKSAKDKSSERESASNEREKVAADLKQTLSATKDAYMKAKESVKAGFETTFDKEFEAIKSDYGAGTGSRRNSGPKGPTKSAAEKAALRKQLYNERQKSK